jgi:hypothetical protein
VTVPRRASDGHAWPDRPAATVVAAGVVLLVFIGFTASYATLRDLAVSAGRFSPWLAPIVPLSFDLGIVVLSLKVVLAAKEGRSAVRLRLLVAGLSASTVVANASAAPTLIGRLLHAIPPAMFVICFESVTGSARRDATRAQGAAVTVPQVRPLLLLLAPLVTCRNWRREVLEELRRRPVSAAPAPESRSMPMTEGPVGVGTARPPVKEVTVSRRSAQSGGAIRGDAPQARLRCAQEELHVNPNLTAAALANVLQERGYPCSVRTAQRVKAQALALHTPEGTELAGEDAA